MKVLQNSRKEHKLLTKIQNLLNADYCLADGEPRYELQYMIGEGGVGVVFACHDKQMNRAVALKTSPHPDTEKHIHKAFEREAKISSLVSHPHIVTIYDSFVCGNYAVLIREYFPETFSHFIDSVAEQTEDPGLERALQFLEPAAEAIQAAHNTQEEKEAETGVFHRDIKAENILINRDVKKVIAKVSDWGSAGLPSSMSSAMSTLCTRAPETFSGKHTQLSDIYSLAVVFVSALKGKQAKYLFANTALKSDKKYLDSLVAPLRAVVPENAWKTLRNCVDPDPGKRCSSIDEFIDMLKGQGAVEINTRKPAGYSAPAALDEDTAKSEAPAIDSGFMERYHGLEQEVNSARPEGPFGTYSSQTVGKVLQKLNDLKNYAKTKFLRGKEHDKVLKDADSLVLKMCDEDIGRIRDFCDIVKKGTLTDKDHEELKKKGFIINDSTCTDLKGILENWRPYRRPKDSKNEIYNP